MTDMTDGWTEWKGGPCPVPLNERVYLRFRDGDTFFENRASRAGDWIADEGGLADCWQMSSDGSDGGDIVAYKPAMIQAALNEQG